jgi:hypothetical protein
MFKTFKDAKKEADRIGGIVTWWCSYSVHKASEYNQATCGTAKYVSKKAAQFFRDRYKKEERIRQKAILKFVEKFRRELINRKSVLR